LTALAESRQFAGLSREAAQLSAEAVSLAERLGDDEVLVNALSGRHLSLMHAENLDERLTMGARLVDLARRTGDRERELRSLHPRLFDLLERGDLAAARSARQRLEELAAEVRQPLFAHFAVVWSCTFAQIDGRLDDAERLAFQAYEMRRTVDEAGAVRVLSAQLCMVRHAQGRVAEQWSDVLESRARYPSLSVWRAAAPLATAATGFVEGATADLKAQVTALDRLPHDLLWLGSVWLLSEAALELRVADAAEPLYRALAPYADRWAQIGQGGNAGPVARSLGRMAALLGDTDAAVGHLEDAVRRSAAAGAAAFEAQARADLAELGAATRTSA
jgi:hypothetical protein